MNGKTIVVSSFSASADGKTLTEGGTASATNEKIKAVYDRRYALAGRRPYFKSSFPAVP